MAKTDTAVPTALYAAVEVTPHRDQRYLRSRGPQLAPDWPTRYLEHLAQHATMWRAAKQAGVSITTVQRLRDADPRFAQDERDALREAAEAIEEKLDRIGDGDDMPAVTSNIVRLKKLLPADYVEKNLSITASFATELDPAEGKALLAAILNHTQPSLPPAPTETP
jgi:hypothetical protein